MWKLRFVVLIIEMMQLWLNNVFNHEIWLGNELISRMEKTKIPPSSLGVSAKEENWRFWYNWLELCEIVCL